MPAKIMIVDDEPLIRDLLCEFLTSQGYIALLASSGEEALRLASESDLKLALVDLRLPDLDGIEVIKRLKKANPELICVIITAHPTPDSRQQAKELGALAYLTKPFRLPELQNLIQSALK